MLHQKPDIFCKIELGLPLSKVQDLLAEIDSNYGEIIKYKVDSEGQRKRNKPKYVEKLGEFCTRVINPPTDRLKRIQKRINKYFNNHIVLPDYAFGAVKKHADHGAMREYKAFAAAGVPVYAGYMPQSMPEGLVWNFVEDGGEFKVGNVSVRGKRIDHYYSSDGYKLVTAYEVDCGDDAGNAVILHSGDGRNYEQLAPEKSVDFFIFHVSVGLNIQKAIDKVQPRYAVFSHAWELGHQVEKWRWTIDDLVKKSQSIEGFPAERLVFPCWGEVIDYKRPASLK